MVRKIAFVIVIVLTSFSLKAQMLRGKIVDTKSQPVPFSTVFVKEVSFGTAANEEGIFELRLAEGEYTCIFQCMGYQTITKKVVVRSADNPLVIILPAMIYSLQEVVVGGGEDPAYRSIMRKVIRKAPLYAGMVKSFNAEVYIRGSLHIKKISSMVKWMAREDLKESNIKEGDTYLEESVNEIEFTAPNLTRQKVKSIHSTFPGGTIINLPVQSDLFPGNIYQPGSIWECPISAGSRSFQLL